MKKKRSIEEEQPKTVCALGVLAAIVGGILYFFNPDTSALQAMISAKEVVAINIAGVCVMFVGFYFALVILPDPKKK